MGIWFPVQIPTVGPGRDIFLLNYKIVVVVTVSTQAVSHPLSQWLLSEDIQTHKKWSITWLCCYYVSQGQFLAIVSHLESETLRVKPWEWNLESEILRVKHVSGMFLWTDMNRSMTFRSGVGPTPQCHGTRRQRETLTTLKSNNTSWRWLVLSTSQRCHWHNGGIFM